MDYTTLDEITNRILAIISGAVNPPLPTPPTTPVLPELLTDQNQGLGFYLYHVQENSHYKNYPAPGNDTPSVAYVPMALNLYYQLSANSQTNNEEDAIEEQKLMSAAMKALHDQARITNIPASPGQAAKDIDIKITLQTLTPSESIQYWAAADSPVRLSAYYEVSVVFLPPETSKIYPGRVLSYGNYIFVKGAPRIMAIANIVTFTVPGDPAMQISVSPAQAPPNQPFPAVTDNNSIISITGTGLGNNLQLLLINSAIWSAPAVADNTWQVTLINENSLTAVVQQTAQDSSGGAVTIVPGLYAAQIVVTETKTLPDMTTKTFSHSSNLFPFSIIPRISLTAINVTGGQAFSIKGYLFIDIAIPAGSVQVLIGEDSLTPIGAGVPAAGEFIISSSGQIDLKAPAALPKGPIPVRVLVNGVESTPQWIIGI